LIELFDGRKNQSEPGFAHDQQALLCLFIAFEIQALPIADSKRW
jgi:hypothetical protein